MTAAHPTIVRREVLLALTATLAAPRPIAAQPAPRVARIALYTTDAGYRDAIVGVLRERGWVEGRNISFAWHPAEGPRPCSPSTWPRHRRRSW